MSTPVSLENISYVIYKHIFKLMMFSFFVCLPCSFYASTRLRTRRHFTKQEIFARYYICIVHACVLCVPSFVCMRACMHPCVRACVWNSIVKWSRLTSGYRPVNQKDAGLIPAQALWRFCFLEQFTQYTHLFNRSMVSTEEVAHPAVALIPSFYVKRTVALFIGASLSEPHTGDCGELPTQDL